MKTKQIAKDYDIDLINVTKNNIERIAKEHAVEKSELTNNAYVIGNDEILLGLYDDKELKLASFFHEIGHTLITEKFKELINYDLMLIEYQAWIEGLKVARKYGYKFSNKTFEYILKSLNSFYEDALNIYNKHKKI
jgi:hypothetical protein